MKCKTPGCTEDAAEETVKDPETREWETRPRLWCGPCLERRRDECLAAWENRKSPDYNVIRVDFTPRETVSE